MKMLHPPFIPEIGVPNEDKYLLVWKETAAIFPVRKKVGILLQNVVFINNCFIFA